MDNQRQAVAQRIKGLRDASDLTVSDVAAKTGVEAETYARYETGAADVPMSYLSVLAALYKVEVTALLTGGEAHGAALTGDGQVWTWGDNQHGQLGDGTSTRA